MDMGEICRTCLKNSNPLLPHFDLDECATPGKTYGQLLVEYTQIKLNDDHETQMPHGICATCCSEIKRIYAFITHAMECNRKLMNMLTNGIASKSKHQTLNQPDNHEGDDEEALNFQITNSPPPFAVCNSNSIDVKNEPIANDDPLMAIVVQEAAGEIAESEEELFNSCTQLGEDNISMDNIPNKLYKKTYKGISEFSTSDMDDMDNKLQLILENQDRMEQKLIEMQETMEHRMQNMQEENRTCHSEIINKKVSNAIDFPVKSVEDLDTLNLKISCDMDKYVGIMKTICSQGGIYPNFNRLFCTEVILSCNYDGINNKKPFKNLQALNSALFDAVKTEGYSNKEFVTELRKSFKNFKNRHFRKVCVEKFKNKT